MLQPVTPSRSLASALRRRAWLRGLAAGLAGVLVAALAVPAIAHDVELPVAGTQLTIDTTGAEPVFVFLSEDAAIGPGADPRTHDSAVIVRSLDGAQSSGSIQLQRSRWSVESGVHEYDDPTGSRGGIRRVVLQAGSLRIEGGGPGFPLDPDGSESGFEVLYRTEIEWACAEFAGASIDTQGNGLFTATGADAPLACEPEFCGNGLRELGEACDDGNFVEDDSCTSLCEPVSCESEQSFDSTFEAIQSVVFEGYSCTNAACHGQAAEGGLDLRAGAAYDELFRTPSSVVEMLRVEPGEPELSFLYEKLAAGTLGTPTTNTPMPSGAVAPLTQQHLEAVFTWIRKGASRDAVVEGTAELLGSCLPPETPLKIDAPPHPGPGLGVQLQQTAYLLEPEGEEELCMATWYDFTGTGLIPEENRIDCGFGAANNPSGQCFRYHEELLLQDPQSHHSIIHLYTGPVEFTADNVQLGGNEGFGPFTFKPNRLEDSRFGEPCDPFDVDPALGYNPDCSGRDQSAVACIGWGPPGAQVSPAFSGSQEPYYEQEFADGVFSVLPMSGWVIWNSHAFNLTSETSTMAQYLNLYLAEEEDWEFPLRGIFDADDIFGMDVPPFETQEICGSYVLPKHSRLFRLSSHTHQWGTRFRIWEPPNEDCVTNPDPSRPTLPVCTPGPEERLLYFSTEYTDPVQLDFEPPRLYRSDEPDDRRFRYCSLYDNGSTEASPGVHARGSSNSFFCDRMIGQDEGFYCIDGPKRGEACEASGDCDSSPGAGDGLCDQVCEVHGGVKTTDEMFILLGSFFVDATPPSIELEASPAVIAPGDATTLAWSAPGASTCTASGAWSGSRQVDGSESLAPSGPGDVEYTLDCGGPGWSVQDSVRVTVDETLASSGGGSFGSGDGSARASGSSFCGLVGLELLAVLPLARTWTRRRHHHQS